MNENKKLAIVGIIFTLIIVIGGVISSAVYNKKIYEKNKINANIGNVRSGQDIVNNQDSDKEVKRAVRIEGKVYYDTGNKSTALRCGMMDGKITSNIESNKIPEIDNQSNFGGEYGFQYGTENTIEVLINNEWCIFELENADKVEEYSFYGKVIEASQNYIIVEPNVGETIRNSADKISVGLGKDNDALYEIGTNVKITYTGYVMESYPAQVKATNIEIKSAENFEIRFYGKHPQNEAKAQKILEASETANYDYNIYSYDGSVNILINGEEISLRNALLENKITMNEIIEKANKDLNDNKIKGEIYKDRWKL